MQKSYNSKKERKLRNAARKKINEIERLKEEVKKNDDGLSNTETKGCKFLIFMKKNIYYIRYI